MGENITKMLGRFGHNEVFNGIPGSGADQDGVPYSLTEEFTSVYRLHTLIPVSWIANELLVFTRLANRQLS